MQLESSLERYFVKQCAKRGWRAIKLIDAGRAGWPDRGVFKPDGRIFWAELKTETGKLSKIQEHRIKQLRLLNQTVYVMVGKDEIDRILDLESSML